MTIRHYRQCTLETVFNPAYFPLSRIEFLRIKSRNWKIIPKDFICLINSKDNHFDYIENKAFECTKFLGFFDCWERRTGRVKFEWIYKRTQIQINGAAFLSCLAQKYGDFFHFFENISCVWIINYAISRREGLNWVFTINDLVGMIISLLSIRPKAEKTAVLLSSWVDFGCRDVLGANYLAI